MLYFTSLISISFFRFPSGPKEASRDLNLKKKAVFVCVSDAVSVSLRGSVQRDPPVRSCDQQDPVAVERFPIHHERHV